MATLKEEMKRYMWSGEDTETEAKSSDEKKEGSTNVADADVEGRFWQTKSEPSAKVSPREVIPQQEHGVEAQHSAEASFINRTTRRGLPRTRRSW